MRHMDTIIGGEHALVYTGCKLRRCWREPPQHHATHSPRCAQTQTRLHSPVVVPSYLYRACVEVDKQLLAAGGGRRRVLLPVYAEDQWPHSLFASAAASKDVGPRGFVPDAPHVILIALRKRTAVCVLDCVLERRANQAPEVFHSRRKAHSARHRTAAVLGKRVWCTWSVRTPR